MADMKMSLSLKELGRKAANEALDNFVYKGLTLREWADKITSGEYEPVKHGRWIHHAGMNSKCSCCGRYFPVAEFEQRPFDVNFCIHCGAKMDGGED